MGMLGTSSSSTTPKRKGCAINDLLEVKRSLSIQQLRREFDELVEKKIEFQEAQKTASLFVNTLKIDEPSCMDGFANLYEKVVSLSFENETDQKQLLDDIIRESIIIEWPRSFPLVSSSSTDSELDFAPLIHRARNVVKCRTSHPTMRVKICAISKNNNENLENGKVLETFLRASLVKLSTDSNDSKLRQVAGRLILTQREGIPAAKSHETYGASVNSEGRIISNQSSKDASILVFGDQLNEQNIRSTRFKYENGVLCTTFPEMGVTLNSMIDRRQLATRYAIQVEVYINIANKIIFNHNAITHPFLIAITNDQTEPLLQSIYWHRMMNKDHIEPHDSLPETSTIPWRTLKQAIRGFVKSQIGASRFLNEFEIFHIQCMILLPRVIKCESTEELQITELSLFGDIQAIENASRYDEIKRIRNRLLRENVAESCNIEKKEFMIDRCISILDMTTELNHSTWLWLHRAAEMIQDVGHKLCPSPSIDKKTTKTKKQMAAAEDYQTVLSLFNKGFITFSSTQTAADVFATSDITTSTMLLRFCDENLGHFSFCYGLSAGKPKIGSISAEQVKDFKQGLPEVLLDEHYPSKFLYLAKFVENGECEVILKNEVFHNFKTLRTKMESVAIMDNDTNRVDVLSGAQLARQTPPPIGGEPVPDFSSLFGGNSQLAVSLLPLLQNSGFDFSCLLKDSNQSEINESNENSNGNDLQRALGNEEEQDSTDQIAKMLLNEYK